MGDRVDSSSPPDEMSIVAFVPTRPSWIETDLAILRDIGPTYVVDVFDIRPRHFLTVFLQLVKADVAYFWFGSHRHWPFIIFAKATRTKIVMVAGGYEVSNIPTLGYGGMSGGRFSRWCRRSLLHRADLILAVSDFTRQQAIDNAGISRAKLKTVPLAFLPPGDRLTPWLARARQVALLISVSPENQSAKGIDRIADLCRELPDIQFKWAGTLPAETRQSFRAEKLTNLLLMGFVPFRSQEFVDLLNSSRVVCLPSRTESFGAALVDGALFGCVPIAFAVGAIPYVIENIGVAVIQEDVTALANAIARAADLEDVDVEDLRTRILDKFSRSARERTLRACFSELIDRPENENSARSRGTG